MVCSKERTNLRIVNSFGFSQRDDQQPEPSDFSVNSQHQGDVDVNSLFHGVSIGQQPEPSDFLVNSLTT